ncbi:MAG TPA: hypothetical protein RMH99_24915, partial [Sandaracinaceae bacterium LLY-WYZ-13_1]|nr:hypothetical protein [Sandaracinaceae bacterium LLY-WYZ-13_1]
TAAQEPVSPLEGVPDELRTLVEACLAKDPSARPPDAAALAPRLDAAMEALRREGGWDRPVDHAHFARGLTEVLPADSTPGASTEAAGATRPLDSSPARPVPPTAAMASAPGVADEADEPEMAIPSGGGILVKLIVGGVALLLLGGVGAMVWGMTSRTFDPTQVVLGVDGDGADFEARMREGFEAELDRFGFRVTVVEDPGDDPRAALLAKADELAAGHVVLLDLTNERARDGLTTETGYFRQGLAVRVLDGESGEEVQTHELVFGHDTLAEAEVAEEIVSAWVHSLGPLLIESLYERPALVQAMEGGAGVEISARAVDIAHNQSDIETIRAERTRLESACAARGEALAAANARSEPRVSCWGDPCGRSRLVGLTPDGSHAIVQDESPRPYYNFRAELRLAQVEERILRVPLDGGEPTVLATASDFHGVGGQSTGPQGHAVAVVEQGRGENLGLVGIDVASGERRVISVLGPRRAPSVVLPSPDGATVYVGGYGHGVMATAEGEDHPVSAWGLRGATWAELPELGVPHVLATYHRFHDEILLLQTDGHPAIEPTDLQGRFRGYAGAKDGLLHVLVSDAHGCYVSRFDPTTGEMVTVTHIDECVEDPQLLPDGRIVGVAEISGPDDTPGDVEIAIVAPGTGAVTALTRGSFREGRPRVAAAGDRIAFERRLDAPEGVRLDDGTVVCWLTP